MSRQIPSLIFRSAVAASAALLALLTAACVIGSAAPTAATGTRAPQTGTEPAIPHVTPTGPPGQLALDERAAIRLQEEVDAGHQPWRLEPESVARSAAEPEGVDLSGARYVVVGLPPDAGRNQTLVRISTPSATLEVELVQPARQGPTGIWAVKAFRRIQ